MRNWKVGDRVKFEGVDQLDAEGILVEIYNNTVDVDITKILNNFKHMKMPFYWVVSKTKLKPLVRTYKQFISERFANG